MRYFSRTRPFDTFIKIIKEKYDSRLEFFMFFFIWNEKTTQIIFNSNHKQPKILKPIG